MSLPKLKRNYSKKDMQTLMDQAKEASDLMKALSHETRLMILCLLSEGEMSVSEIEGIVDLPQATVSQQLARLRFSGLVNTRREGRTIHYKLAEGEVRVVIAKPPGLAIFSVLAVGAT